MASQDGGRGFIWFLIGLLAGVAATLTVLIFFGGRPTRSEAVAPLAAPAVAHAPRKAGPRPRPADETAPASAASAADEQVAEDAAATGMTSRSKHGTDQ